jgi:hypothetical protein
MALFFDSAWFDAKLAQAGLSRDDVATALGLAPSELAEMWKDQRELKPTDVRILAALIGATPAEVASRAGVSTPVPKPDLDALTALSARLDRLEAKIDEIKSLLLSLAARK